MPKKKSKKPKGWFKDRKNQIIALLCAFSLVAVYIVIMKINEINALSESKNNLADEFTVLQAEFGNLNESYYNLFNVMISQEQTIEELQESYYNLINDYSDFEIKIQEQLELFSNNSNVLNHTLYTNIMNKLKSSAFKNTEPFCNIRLQGIYFADNHYYNLEYLDDPESNEYFGGNSLFSLDDFYERGGGDCEDWALVFTAQYNYLKNMCAESDYEIRINSFISEGTSDVQIAYDETWIYLDSSETSWTDYVYAYPLCGFHSGDEYGHCWVAFTKEEITSSQDISRIISDSMIVEPQGGDFVSTYEDAFEQGLKFYIIILPDDMGYKQDLDNSSSWKTYQDYSENIQKSKLNLNKIYESFKS